MNNVLTAVKAIHKADRDELEQIIAAVKLQQTFLAKQNARAFTVGEAVSFKDKQGRTVVGTVRKVNIKTVLVDSPSQGRWKVTASMLRSLEGAQLYSIAHQDAVELRKVTDYPRVVLENGEGIMET